MIQIYMMHTLLLLQAIDNAAASRVRGAVKKTATDVVYVVVEEENTNPPTPPQNEQES